MLLKEENKPLADGAGAAQDTYQEGTC